MPPKINTTSDLRKFFPSYIGFRITLYYVHMPSRQTLLQVKVTEQIHENPA